MTLETRQTGQERRQARRKRLDERAAKIRAKGDAEIDAADAIASKYPMGQPILVGHHSEGRHRRDREKMYRKMIKGVDLRQYARHLENKGVSNSIMTDDADALTQLEAKLKDQLAERERYHQIQRDAKTEADRVPGFVFSNLSKRIKQTEARIEEVKRIRSSAGFDLSIGRFRFYQDTAADRLAIEGTTKADARTIRALGYLWSRRAQRWQRKLTANALYCKSRVIEALENITAEEAETGATK